MLSRRGKLAGTTAEPHLVVTTIEMVALLVPSAIGVGTILVRRTVATTAKPSTAVANLAHRADTSHVPLRA